MQGLAAVAVACLEVPGGARRVPGTVWGGTVGGSAWACAYVVCPRWFTKRGLSDFEAPLGKLLVVIAVGAVSAASIPILKLPLVRNRPPDLPILETLHMPKHATLLLPVTAMLASTTAWAQDSDADGLPDAADNCPLVANADQADCDANGVGNACQTAVSLSTGNMGSIGNGVTTVGTLVGVQSTLWPVRVVVRAIGDFNLQSEYATFRLAGTVISSRLFEIGASDCPATPDIAVFTIPASAWNALVAASPGGNMSVVINGNPLVSAAQCVGAVSEVTATQTLVPDCNANGELDYCEAVSGAQPDCNSNLVPDSCDIAQGLEFDCDGNGRPDRCDIFQHQAEDQNGNCAPDSCEYRLGDYGLDGVVGGDDLAFLLSVWGLQKSLADLSGDGIVAGDDLAILLGNWGPTPFPGLNCAVPAWATVIAIFPDPSVVTDPALRQRIFATGLPWSVRDNASSIEMRLVPPGTFDMGCLGGSNDFPCRPDEQPVHRVTITMPFYLGRFEVTQAQWQAKMGSNPSYFKGSAWPDSSSRPVETVSYLMIQSFLSATGLRLPTEAEWEMACRAGTTTPFPAGPGFPTGTSNDALVGQIAWWPGNSNAESHSVGLKPANTLGFHDMLGNVWEFVSDWYGPYSSADQVDPVGPASGQARGLRGGSWFYISTNELRTSFRSWDYEHVQYAWSGFRVARNP